MAGTQILGPSSTALLLHWQEAGSESEYPALNHVSIPNQSMLTCEQWLNLQCYDVHPSVGVEKAQLLNQLSS